MAETQTYTENQPINEALEEKQASLTELKLQVDEKALPKAFRVRSSFALFILPPV